MFDNSFEMCFFGAFSLAVYGDFILPRDVLLHYVEM